MNVLDGKKIKNQWIVVFLLYFAWEIAAVLLKINDGVELRYIAAEIFGMACLMAILYFYGYNRNGVKSACYFIFLLSFKSTEFLDSSYTAKSVISAVLGIGMLYISFMLLFNNVLIKYKLKD